jgi:glutamate/aspartate transport system permease protein
MHNYHWNWGIFFQTIPSGDVTYLTWVIHALGWTITISIFAWIIALVLGSLMGTLRTTQNRLLVLIGHAWVEFFRNVPVLMQLFMWYFVVPEFLPHNLSMWVKQDMPAKEFITATIALGLFTSARVAEQVRAGIQALSRGQRNAGLALGFTQTQTYRYVLLPMAFRIIIPPLTSEFMNVFKNSGVAYAVGVWELVFVSAQMVEETGGQVFESLLVPTVLYIICCYIANRIMHVIEQRSHVPGFIVAK